MQIKNSRGLVNFIWDKWHVQLYYPSIYWTGTIKGINVPCDLMLITKENQFSFGIGFVIGLGISRYKKGFANAL